MDGDAAAKHYYQPVNAYYNWHLSPFKPQHIAIAVITKQQPRVYANYFYCKANNICYQPKKIKIHVLILLCPYQ